MKLVENVLERFMLPLEVVSGSVCFLGRVMLGPVYITCAGSVRYSLWYVLMNEVANKH